MTVRVSISSSGSQGNGAGLFRAAVSSTGRFVAFHSSATNLILGDTNGVADIFLRDTLTATTTVISVDSTGVQANEESGTPAISADGRFVTFQSSATNLVPGDTNAFLDVFVHDILTGTTARVSVDSSGAQTIGGHSSDAVISADGRFVAFHSGATNLVPGDTNGFYDVFVHDMLTGATTRASVDSSGVQAIGGGAIPSISGDGRFVAFKSGASNLVPGDTNGADDIFLRDTVAGTTARVSVSSADAQANNNSYFSAVSYDGRFVAFDSGATNLVAGDTNGFMDVFLRDTSMGTTVRVSVDSSGAEASSAASNASSHAVSSDERFVVFTSDAANLVAGDTNSTRDVFVRDMSLATTVRVSVGADGTQSNGPSYFGASSISADGRYAAFLSDANNLVPGDTNGVNDVFVRGPFF